MKMKSASEVAQSCLTLCDPMDCSLPGSLVLGIFQIRVLECVAIAFSRWLGAQYATGDQWRNNSRKNEGMEPKQKQYPALDVTVIEARPEAVKSNIT